ncbi:MAG: response regulator [bacterium]|nr:response regulator [bacterium]
MKILIVDDDSLIQDMYALKLKEAGFEVFTAHEGKTAIATVAKEKPDAVLLDVILPQMDGFEILQELKTQGLLAATRVIMLTNVGERKDVERGMELGASDYIIKANFTPSQVVEKVKKILKK